MSLEGVEMSKSPNQKLKLLYILDYLKQHTDENHGVAMADIVRALENNGIAAERKSIYDDISLLRLFGYDIMGEPEKGSFHYRLVNREFELAELKLLVDAVQFSKYITEKKSNELIKKLESLASKYEAKTLQRQVYVSGRIKSMNESIYYNVDELHQAINENVQIKFQYREWTVDKKMVNRRNGEFYTVSPWGLIQDDENYYLLAYEEREEMMKHFRVDKIINISSINVPRLGKEQMKDIDFASYQKRIFGMYGGTPIKVKMCCNNNLIGVIMDRFGKDVFIMKKDNESFETIVEVVPSKQFYAWVIALGEGAYLVSPESVVDTMRLEIKRLSQQYSV